MNYSKTRDYAHKKNNVRIFSAVTDNPEWIHTLLAHCTPGEFTEQGYREGRLFFDIQVTPWTGVVEFFRDKFGTIYSARMTLKLPMSYPMPSPCRIVCRLAEVS